MSDGPAQRGHAVGVLTITTEVTSAQHKVALAGELDLANAADAEAALERAEALDAPAIVLDLSGLEFMDSTGVALLLRASQRSRADSSRLLIIRPPERVMRILRLTGAEDLLPLAD